MKAAFLIAPGKFEIRQSPEPVPPADGLVLEIKACGVCGSDLRRWREGPPSGIDAVPSGHEIGGIVLSVGENFTRYKIGDRLAIAPDIHCGHCFYCQRGLVNLCDTLHFLGITQGYPGGFSEKIVLTNEVLEYGIVHAIPDNLTYEEGALAEPASSVLAMHERVGTTITDTVVVMGGGPIGCLHIAVSKARGAAVILSEPSPQRRKMSAPFSPEIIVDPSTENLATVVKIFTSGRGADLVICANPIAATQTQAVEIVRKRGKVILFGGLPKANPLTSLDANLIHYNEIEILGSFSYHPRFHELALDIIQRKLLPASKLITHTYSLDNINDAFSIAGSGEALKVIVKP
jgi:L-iditol 2-dehydrogenase